MVVINHVGAEEKVSRVISREIKNISYSNIQKLFRKKDIKINGKRVNSDMLVYNGDEIVVYVTDEMTAVKSKKIDVVFEDSNIIVVNKPIKMEVESVSDEANLTHHVNVYLAGKKEKPAKAVHRLDRNTKGLVVFAKNDKSYNELYKAFKNRTIKKYYEAIVVGVLPKEQDTMVAYLKKDKDKSYSEVSLTPKAGYEKIITKYSVIFSTEDRTYVEVELVTGKTHQIRAHFDAIGHPLVGDGKYGKNQVNKKFREKTQQLLAKKIVFSFEKGSHLYYLNNKKIECKDSLI
jgi:23S rRNA pseudouridine955/2504/2580 synthase